MNHGVSLVYDWKNEHLLFSSRMCCAIKGGGLPFLFVRANFDVSLFRSPEFAVGNFALAVTLPLARLDVQY